MQYAQIGPKGAWRWPYDVHIASARRRAVEIGSTLRQDESLTCDHQWNRGDGTGQDEYSLFFPLFGATAPRQEPRHRGGEVIGGQPNWETQAKTRITPVSCGTAVLCCSTCGEIERDDNRELYPRCRTFVSHDAREVGTSMVRDTKSSRILSQS